jgi:hypothetical protein
VREAGLGGSGWVLVPGRFVSISKIRIDCLGSALDESIGK